MSGTVSFHTADEDHWDAATLNYPVTSGDAFWTEPGASASIEISASRVDMASTTEFDVDQLDDHSLTATEAQGEVFLDLRDLQSGETFTVRTPRGVVTMTAAGQYEIAAGDTQSPTMVTVLDGSAQIAGDSLSLSVPAGQTATITGSGGTGDAFKGSLGPQQRDTFLASELTAGVPTAAEATAQATVSAHAPPSTGPCDTNTPPAAVQQMPGGRQLSSYGSWQNNSQYGRVWYPQVSQDWVPYRDGHWAWVAPWGWTWIDAEPWGYAPFHYGRWVQVDSRWAWAPVWYGPGFVVPPFYRPVFAPALVGFFGFGVGLAAGLSIGVGIRVWLGLGSHRLVPARLGRAVPAVVPYRTRLLHAGKSVQRDQYPQRHDQQQQRPQRHHQQLRQRGTRRDRGADLGNAELAAGRVGRPAALAPAILRGARDRHHAPADRKHGRCHAARGTAPRPAGCGTRRRRTCGTRSARDSLRAAWRRAVAAGGAGKRNRRASGRR